MPHYLSWVLTMRYFFKFAYLASSSLKTPHPIPSKTLQGVEFWICNTFRPQESHEATYLSEPSLRRIKETKKKVNGLFQIFSDFRQYPLVEHSGKNIYEAILLSIQSLGLTTDDSRPNLYLKSQKWISTW